jgi:F-type H+/Na+-transporting ATPase subunit beta
MADKNIGKVVQVIGPVVDVEFAPEHLPDIYNALRIEATTADGTRVRVTAEVQQHIGRGQVRAVAMSSTDGIVRGMDVVDTGDSITVPVGTPALGRILNVLGEPVDEAGEVGGDDAAKSSGGPFTAIRRSSRTSSPRPRSSRPGSRSSTCWLRT